MTLGEKLKKLRKEKNWSQQYLSDQLGVHTKHISRYENNVNKPSLEMLRKLSDLFNVSVDYLVNEEASNINFKDKELEKYFEKVDKLDEDDKKLVKAMLDAVLVKNEVTKIKTRQP